MTASVRIETGRLGFSLCTPVSNSSTRVWSSGFALGENRPEKFAGFDVFAVDLRAPARRCPSLFCRRSAGEHVSELHDRRDIVRIFLDGRFEVGALRQQVGGKAPAIKLGDGPCLEFLVHFRHGFAVDFHPGVGFGDAVTEGVHEVEHLGQAILRDQVLIEPLRFAVGQLAVNRALRLDESPVEVGDGEEFAGAVLQIEELAIGPIARGFLLLAGGGFGEPVRDAVVGHGEGDGVGVFVAEDAGPVEGAHHVLGAAAGDIHGDDVSGGSADGADPGQAGGADAELLMRGEELNGGRRRQIGHMEIAPDFRSHLFHPLHGQLGEHFILRVVLDDEGGFIGTRAEAALAFEGGEFAEHFEEFELVEGPEVVGIDGEALIIGQLGLFF